MGMTDTGQRTNQGCTCKIKASCLSLACFKKQPTAEVLGIATRRQKKKKTTKHQTTDMKRLPLIKFRLHAVIL